VLLLGGYALGLGAMIWTRGLYLTPDRYFVILLVPALCLGVARRYVRDFAPFILLMLLYEELRGVAHIVSPHPYYMPQLDLERALFGGAVPTIWLQKELWHGHLELWQEALAVLIHLHFIVPPTLLFLVWLRDRARYFRFAAAILVVSYAGALGFALFPAAPPWMAAHAGLIPHLVRIDELPLGPSQLSGASHSLLYRWMLGNNAAAIPSLHAAYALIVLLICLSLSRWLGLLAVPYAVLMWFAIVLFGEHYVVDAIIGVGFALAAWAFVGWLLPRTRFAGPFEPPLASARGAPRPRRPPTRFV
jgi:hypothetical protein